MKRLCTLILVLAMVAAMIVMPVHAAQEEQAETMQVGYCQHCKTVIPEDKWLPWNASNSFSWGSHYYLAEDIKDQQAQVNIGLDDDLYRNQVCLDLRGRTYTVTGLRPFLISGVLSIMDSVGGGEIAVTGASNAHGGFAMMGKSTGCKDGAGELNLYSGTIRKINTSTDQVSYGGLLILGDGATYNQYGGKMIGGEVVPHLIGSANYAPRGGAIYSTGGNINIYGGTLTGGVSRSGTLLKPGSTTETQKFEGAGGNIYITGGTLNVYGGVIENGYADVYGGNIYATGSTVNISGGEIRGGASAGASGNIQFSGAAKLTISGGTVAGGVCRTRGGNLFVNDAKSQLEISGGTLYGDLSIGYFKEFTLSGTPKILMGNSNGLRLQTANATKVNISNLTEGAEIYLDGVDQVFSNALDDAESYLPYFKDAVRADISVDESGALKVAQGATGFCPHCWETGVQAQWTPFDNSTPNANISFTAALHTYFTSSISRTRLLDIKAGADVVVDMAGYSLTVTGYRFASTAGKLSIMDSLGFGVITGTGHAGANGGVIMGGGSGTVINMYSGTLSRSVKSGESTKRIFDGGVLYAMNGSQVNIHGGIIRDGIASIAFKNSPMAATGGNIHAAGSFTMTGGILLNGQVMSSYGYVSGTTDEPVNTATLYVGSGGNLYVSGNAAISGGHIIGGQAGYGGNVYAANGNLAITGGVIRDGVTNDSLVADDYGGNIYYSSTKVATVENALIRGGKTSRLGGNISLSGSTLTVTDALIAEGTAGIDSSNGCGGNIYANATSKLYLNGATVSGGYAYNIGGNLYGLSGSLIHMTGGILSGGTTETGHGGSVYACGFLMTGGRVVGGTSTAASGGNIFIESGVNNYLTAEPGADGAAPVIANGTSGKLGGNIFVNLKATGTFTGALICNGKGDTKNSTSVFNGDNLYGSENAKLTLTDCTVSGIQATTVSGSGVYAGGVLTLQGDTNITNEENRSCAYIGSTGSLTVDAGFTGNVSIAFQNVHLADVASPQGTTLAAQNTATGAFSGTLLLEGYNGKDYGLPAIFAEDNQLHIASTAVIDPALDTVQWFKDCSAAADSLTASSYLKLYKAENTLILEKDAVVDLNGNDLTVTGAGTLYGFDSENDDYDGCGTVVSDGTVAVEKVFMAPNGRRYVAITDENGISFHRLGIAITGVALRPSVAGVYYKAVWECDDALKANIQSCGVAVSTADMPTADFMTDTDTLYTTVAADSFISGQSVTSAMIENIVKAGADNQARGTVPIYAAAYAVVDGMTIVADDNAPTMGGAIYSMKTVLQGINRIWPKPKLTDIQKSSIRDLYAMDAEVFETWGLYNITADITGTPAIRPLKILTLGHSLAVDSGHMLNLVAAAEGYDQPFEIGTLYYSGCPLWRHVTFLQQNAPVYYLYLSSSTTPDAPPTITKGVTMEYGIEYDDWDVIIMQGGVFEIAHDETYNDGNIQIIQEYVNQHKTNPDAVFGWHMPWACPTDNELRDIYTSKPNTFYTSYEVFDHNRINMYNAVTDCVERRIITDDSFVYLIPSGTAIENAVSSYLTEKDLYRDYVHVSDVGRVISSYTWYCTLAGIDRLDEVKLDAIPKAFLKSTADKTVDYVLSEEEKAIILEAVNNALANPLQLTQSQYTQAP